MECRPRMQRRSWQLSLAVAGATWIAAAPVAAQPSAAARESLTAIDILLLPGRPMVDRAGADNARLRESFPAGFALDDAHRPHVTLLQRFVVTEKLDDVYAAVGRVLERRQPVAWELEATGYFYVDFDGLAVAGIVVRPTPELRQLQHEIAQAVAPYTRSNGTAAAFVTTAADPEINRATIDYVRAFVPNQMGTKYNPHVTIGVAPNAVVDRMKAAPFPAFKFPVAGAAVFHLGNFGTAAQELWIWQPAAAASALKP